MLQVLVFIGLKIAEAWVIWAIFGTLIGSVAWVIGICYLFDSGHTVWACVALLPVFVAVTLVVGYDCSDYGTFSEFIAQNWAKAGRIANGS